MDHQNLSSFIWSVADLLRGDYKQSDYGKVILPFTVLRRLDCVLEAHQARRAGRARGQAEGWAEPRALPAQRRPGRRFYNTSPMDMRQAAWATRTTSARTCSPTSRRSRRLCATSSSGSTSTLRSRSWRSAGLLYQVTEKFARHRPPPRQGRQRPDGPGLRGADPQVRGAVQRDGRRALHPARGDPADGQPAVRRGRRGAVEAGRGAHHLRPDGGHGRHAVGGRGVPGGAEPQGPAHHVRPGAERRVLRHLQGRHAHQGAGRRPTSSPATRCPTTATRTASSTTCSPTRRSAWSGRRSRRRSAREHESAGLQRPLRPGPAAGLGRLAAVPDAPPLQDAPGQGRRQPLRHRAQRLAAVHRRRRQRARARSGATCWRTTCWRPSSRCPPTCSTTPASPPTSGSSPTASPSRARARCSSSTPALLAEDAQEPGLQAQGDGRGAHRHRDAAVRRVRGGAAGDRARRGGQGGRPRGGRRGRDAADGARRAAR